MSARCCCLALSVMPSLPDAELLSQYARETKKVEVKGAVQQSRGV